VALSLGWLGNLHYWTILLLADFRLSRPRQSFPRSGQAAHAGPVLVDARHLPTLAPHAVRFAQHRLFAVPLELNHLSF